MTAETQRAFVLPGDPIDPSLIPSHPKKALRLGPGLRHIPPNELVPTVAGQLVSDPRKNSIWVEYQGGRYIPSAGDLVIGTVQRTTGDYLHVSLGEHAAAAGVALLPQLSFEAATKKARPSLAAGALVYARVALADRHLDPELECVSPATGRADGLGPLAAGSGMLYAVSPGMARRLLMRRAAEEGGVVVLDELASFSSSSASAGGGGGGLAFETAVGRNGRLWVASESVKTVLAVGRAVQETDERNLGVEQQKKLVRKLIKDMS